MISRKYEKGIRHAYCIDCFFAMKQALMGNAELYRKRYGLVPSFKAGIHFGKVIAGEIGIIKRDITFSGDVLNTTSRIQSKCKEFEVEVIASADLLSRLALDGKYLTHHLGNIKLRGKKQSVELSTVIPI